MSKISLANPELSFDLRNSMEVEKLREYLLFEKPPEKTALQDVGLQRSRLIGIPWTQLIGDNDQVYRWTRSGPRSSLFGHLSRYLHTIWFGRAEFHGDPYRDLTDDELAIVRPSDDAISLNHVHFFVTDQLTISAYAIAGETFSDADFANVTAYNEFWGKVDYLSITSDSMVMPTYIEELDLAAIALRQKADQLEAQESAARQLQDAASSVLEGSSNNITPAIVDQLIANDRRLRGPLEAWEFTFDALQRKARELGFKIERSATPGPSPPFPLLLRQVHQRCAEWNLIVRRPSVRSRSTHTLVDGTRVFEYEFPTEPLCNFRIRQLEIPVNVDGALSTWGVPTKPDEIRFRQDGNAYTSDAGCLWDDTLWNLTRSRDDRELWIPVYEDDRDGQTRLVRLMKAKTPAYPATPIRTPRIYIQETLGIISGPPRVVLGELVRTVNLAPGEERLLTFETKTTSETEVSTTATSALDVTTDDTNDFQSEFERELRNSTERTSRSQWNAKASGSIGAFGGSASGGGSRSKTVKSFANELRKTVAKASNSVTRKSKREVSNSSSARNTTSSQETVTINLRNVNEGRTLNLAFYDLLNVRDFHLTLKEIRFVLDPGMQAIEGLPSTLPLEFELGQLDEMLEAVDIAQLPVARPLNYEAARSTVKSSIISGLIEALLDYDVSGGDESTHQIEIPNLRQAKQHANSGSAEEALQLLRAGLARIRYIADAHEPLQSDVVVGSPGLYVDSFVGARAATEPYAEWMRLKEVEQREADVERNLSIARSFNASSFTRLPSGGFVIHAQAISTTELHLTFATSPGGGRWALFIDNQKILQFDLQDDAVEITVTPGGSPDWLSPIAINYGAIRRETDGKTGFFVI